MEVKKSSTTSHREWRRIAKRERRRKIRRKAAQERDSDAERLTATLERTAEYSNWLAAQEQELKEREIAEKREHDEREKLWLENEVQAQKEWRVLQERRAKIRREQQIQEEIIRKEFELKREEIRLKNEETKRLREEEMQKHVDLQKEIDEYIDNGTKTPEVLRIVSESQANKDPCPFFTKTGACRYGDACSRNHRRYALTNVILVPGFYTHFSLEKNSAEYDTDVSLEFDGAEMRQDYREFYESVVPELESFGCIRNLKCCRNAEVHLRGNLYVEYETEREAARALRNLKGRYYAQRQLNCEFVNIACWRNAICGMAKCPKGRACNFLHTFRNPDDRYDMRSSPRRPKKSKENTEGSTSSTSQQRSKSRWDDWDRGSTENARNWRWSESPEAETKSRGKNERSRRGSHRASDSSHRDDSDSGSTSRRRSRERRRRSDRERDRSRVREKRSRRDGDSGGKEVDHKSKKSKSRSRSCEERRRDKKGKSSSRRHQEEKVPDENVDTNSNNSSLGATKKKPEEKSSERSFRGCHNDSFSQTPPKIASSPNDNDWDTTDSQ